MLFVGVDWGELLFLAFMLLTILSAVIGVWKNALDRPTIALMWVSYGAFAAFLLIQILEIVTVDDTLSRNLYLVAENWRTR